MCIRDREYSVSLQILLIMTALSFIPAFVMLMTSFTRIIIVFSILRQALGLQQTPSNQMLVGLALFLTLFIMAPIFDRINTDALQPVSYTHLDVYKRQDHAGGDSAQIRLLNCSSDVRKILAISNFEQLFQIS